MKKTFSLLTAALALMFALTGCSGNGNSGTSSDGQAGTSMTGDQNYTANENGRSNEAGDDGTHFTDRNTASDIPDNSSDRSGNGTNNGTGNGMNSGNGTTSRTTGYYNDNSTVADNVQNAVNQAGDVVDDVADGAANVVDSATDMVQDTAGTTRTGNNRTGNGRVTNSYANG